MSKMFALGALLVLGVRTSKASGVECEPTKSYFSKNYCRYDQYCCGPFKNLCCNFPEPDISYDVTAKGWVFIIGVLVTLFITAVVLICCRVCCKSITQSGVVLRAPSTTTSACTYYTVPLNIPPQQLYYPHRPNYTSAMNTENSSRQYSLPAHQDSARSNINMPPPAYNQAAGVQL